MRVAMSVLTSFLDTNIFLNADLNVHFFYVKIQFVFAMELNGTEL